MKITTSGPILTPLLALLGATVLPAVSAAELTNTLNHVYVVGPDASGRATIGKALSRLGYVPTASSSSSSSGSDDGITLTMSESASHGFTYTEIATQGEAVGDRASYIIVRQGLNQSAVSGGLGLSSVLRRRSSDSEKEDTREAWWKRMVGFGSSMPAGADAEGELLELSLEVGEARGSQAEKWVALCDFLGLGYSTVERLNLWQFP